MSKFLLIVLLIGVLSQDTQTPGNLNAFIGKLSEEDIEIIEYAFKESSQADINPEKFIRLIWCESQFQIRGGDWNEKTQRYDSHGLLQFQRPTFNYLSKNSGIQGDYKDSFTQIKLAVWTINYDSKGLNHWWTCSRRAKFTSNDYLKKKLVLE